MNDHLKGLIITGLGVLFVVPDSLFVSNMSLISHSRPGSTVVRNSP